MAFRDTWHRTLVYFGLAEDDAYDDEDLEPYPEPEAELQDSYRDRPNVRKLSSRRRRDEFDDIFADDAPQRTPHHRVAAGHRRAAGQRPGPR
jgi:cell division inhibitor SepF